MKKIVATFLLLTTSTMGQTTNDFAVFFNGTNFYSKHSTAWNPITNANLTVDTLTATNNLTTTFRGSDDLRVPLTTVRLGTVKPPDFDQWYGNLRAFAFSGSTEQQVFLTAQLPHTWETNSPISAHLHYDKGSSTLTNSVVFGIEYVWGDRSTVMTNGGTTTLLFTNAMNQTSYWHHMTVWPNMDGSGQRASSIINMRLYRDPDDSGDTFTDDIFVHEIDFHYYIDKPAGEKDLF